MKRTPLDVLLLEFGQEPLPIFVGQFGVFRQLPLDHERLDVIDRMHVLDTILRNPPHLLDWKKGRLGVKHT